MIIIYQSYINHISIIYKSYINHISIIYQSYINHISIIYQSYINHIPIIYQSYINHISNLYLNTKSGGYFLVVALPALEVVLFSVVGIVVAEGMPPGLLFGCHGVPGPLLMLLLVFGF